MSFPTDFTFTTQLTAREGRRPVAEAGNSQNNTRFPPRTYSLPAIDLSTLGLEEYEEARCAACDVVIEKKDDELCAACKAIVAALAHENEDVKREERARDMAAMIEALEQISLQAEIRKALEEGNAKMREEIAVMKKKVKEQQGKNELVKEAGKELERKVREGVKREKEERVKAGMGAGVGGSGGGGGEMEKEKKEKKDKKKKKRKGGKSLRKFMS